MVQRIKTSQEFNQFIAVNAQNPNLGNDILSMRLACYEAIEKLRERLLLIYASKFINALPNTQIILTFPTLTDSLTWCNLFEEKAKALMFCCIAQADNLMQLKE